MANEDHDRETLLDIIASELFDVVYDGRGLKWAEKAESDKDEWRYRARQLLDNLRDPSEEMQLIGGDAYREHQSIAEVWRAMIDGAMAGK